MAPEPTKRGNAKRLVPAPSVLGPCACGLAYGGIVKAMLWPFERGAARLLPPLPFVHGDEGVALGLVFVVVALAIASVPAFLLFRLRSYSAQVAFVVGMLFFVDAGSLMELPTGLPGSFGWIVTLGSVTALPPTRPYDAFAT